MAKIFDIESPEDVFGLLDEKFRVYCDQTAKSAEDILLILMLANHLREWIAPKYNPERNKRTNKMEFPSPKTSEQEFSKKIYEHPNFSIIRQLCNGSKHATKSDLKTTTEYESNVHDWSNVHKVRDVHKGEVIGYLVDGNPIEKIVKPVIAKYAEWFSSAKSP